MIRNYQKNGVDINLNPIYQSISSLKNNIADLESLTTLSSLSGDIVSLSNWCSSLDHWNLELYSEFNDFTNGLDSIIIPMVFSNSSNIESLSSSLLSVNSSLASLQQSCSDITNSFTHMSQNFSEILSTLTGGGLLTNSTFNYQAFNTTYDFNQYLYLTGDFSLPNSTSFESGGVWNLSQLGTDYSFLNNSITSLKKFDLNYVATFSSNYISEITKFNISGNSIMNNTFKNLSFATIEAIKFTRNLIYGKHLDFICSGSLKSNTFNFTPSGVDFLNGFYGSWNSNKFDSIRSLSLISCDYLDDNTFSNCSKIEFRDCKSLYDFSFYKILNFVSFKNINFFNTTKPRFSFDGNNYTCSIIFENCLISSQTAETSAFTSHFTTLNSGASLIYSFR